MLKIGTELNPEGKIKCALCKIGYTPLMEFSQWRGTLILCGGCAGDIALAVLSEGSRLMLYDQMSKGLPPTPYEEDDIVFPEELPLKEVKELEGEEE